MFPLIHIGRPWLGYWLFPYPNTMGVWPQFRLPLIWDVFAVSTYFTVSFLFWYIGLIPDLATFRDSRQDAAGRRLLYGILSLGWRGSARHWKRYEIGFLVARRPCDASGALRTHRCQLDFAVAVLPGWHTTIFPPYFVAGAIYSGFAMVLTLAIPIPQVLQHAGLHHAAPSGQLAKVMLATGQSWPTPTF